MREESYLRRLEARSRQHLQRRSAGKLSDGYIALDLLASIYSAQAAGMPYEKLAAALPVEAWRSDTVTVPAEFLQTLASAWVSFLDQQDIPQGKSLGRCLGVEADSEGSKGAAKIQNTQDKRQGFANRVSLLLLSSEADGNPLKVTAAIALVAEHEGVSVSTVRNAWRQLGRGAMDLYRAQAKTVRG